MDIEKNFNSNLEKSVKKQTNTLPAGSKFLLHQLLKNSHHIEEALENETMVEINVGDLRKVARTLNEKEMLHERKWCSKRKLGKGCDGGDGHKAGTWTNTANGCQCSYGGMSMGWNEREGQGGPQTNSVELEMGEATTTASSGAYSTPRFWAKNKKNQRFASQRLMPGAKYVKVKEKCKKFPYCNQGDINALEIWEKEIMRESAKNVSKKTGKSESEVRKMVEKEIAEIIRRGFYKSPIKNLVGGGKMDTPIGKMFSMSGNKPKYES
jgi:hypothetical protein|tara:strand:- start:755 stop:1555 length:801 start_codon:yes stop_codon:yes gene_type:complete